jgi:hypothetical protein
VHDLPDDVYTFEVMWCASSRVCFPQVIDFNDTEFNQTSLQWTRTHVQEVIGLSASELQCIHSS